MRAAGIASVVLALGAIMSGCNADSEPAGQPTPPPNPAPTPSPPESSPSSKPMRTTNKGEPVGMTIRYLDADGKIKTLRVEDFRR